MSPFGQLQLQLQRQSATDGCIDLASKKLTALRETRLEPVVLRNRERKAQNHRPTTYPVLRLELVGAHRCRWRNFDRIFAKYHAHAPATSCMVPG